MRHARIVILPASLGLLALGTMQSQARVAWNLASLQSLVARYEVIALFEVVTGNVTPETIFEAPEGAPMDFNFHVRPTITLKVIRPLKDCKAGDTYEVKSPFAVNELRPWSVPVSTSNRPRPPLLLNDGQQVLAYVRRWRGSYSAGAVPVENGKVGIVFAEEHLDRFGRGWSARVEALPVEEALGLIGDVVGKWKRSWGYDAARKNSSELRHDYGDNEWLNERILDELIRRGDGDALGALLAKATDLQKDDLAQALGEVPGPRPVPYLTGLLDSHYPSILKHAILGLARPEAKPAVPALIRLARNREYVGTVSDLLGPVAKAMAAIGDPQGIGVVLEEASDLERSLHLPDVIDGLTASTDPRVKEFLLKQLEHPKVVLPPLSRVGERKADIEESERKHERGIAYAAAKALAKQRSDLGMRRLLQMVMEHPPGDFPESKVADLGEVGDKRATPLLLEMLAKTHYDYPYRFIAEALVKIGDERAVQPLIDLVHRTKGQTRQILLGIIGEWDHPKITSMLMAELNGEDRLSMCAAAEVLHKGGVKQAADKLLALLTGGLEGWAPFERSQLYQTLGNMKEERAIPLLITAMATDVENDVSIDEALTRITGADLPADPDAWKNWWQEQNEKRNQRAAPVKPPEPVGGDSLGWAALATIVVCAAVYGHARRRRGLRT
ncbi:hypothetical protein AMK68_04660 [candidate division KD3-62 bacterium DG_56]|uniref:HEAT repeat domain-containing protein n=1 Tax=candidate division KD3-62 bacterium DG_56 TaxID=1704032 RepID=A0A0S7XK75_9BACT|nr:MAG: hypothetical protein AMK68_04660 [candidate division KD3-62 bacterium DG_56]